MGIEIKRDWRGNMSVETDYGAGFVDHKSAHDNMEKLKDYMNEIETNRIKGDDYFNIKMNIDRHKREKEEERKRRYDEWFSERHQKDYCW